MSSIGPEALANLIVKMTNVMGSGLEIPPIQNELVCSGLDAHGKQLHQPLIMPTLLRCVQDKRKICAECLITNTSPIVPGDDVERVPWSFLSSGKLPNMPDGRLLQALHPKLKKMYDMIPKSTDEETRKALQSLCMPQRFAHMDEPLQTALFSYLPNFRTRMLDTTIFNDVMRVLNIAAFRYGTGTLILDTDRALPFIGFTSDGRRNSTVTDEQLLTNITIALHDYIPSHHRQLIIPLVMNTHFIVFVVNLDTGMAVFYDSLADEPSLDNWIAQIDGLIKTYKMCAKRFVGFAPWKGAVAVSRNDRQEDDVSCGLYAIATILRCFSYSNIPRQTDTLEIALIVYYILHYYTSPFVVLPEGKQPPADIEFIPRCKDQERRARTDLIKPVVLSMNDRRFLLYALHQIQLVPRFLTVLAAGFKPTGIPNIGQCLRMKENHGKVYQLQVGEVTVCSKCAFQMIEQSVEELCQRSRGNIKQQIPKLEEDPKEAEATHKKKKPRTTV